MAVKIGSQVPDFTVTTTQGPLKLSDYRGQWVLLFAHPADFTPVCTTEFIGFSQHDPEYKANNCQLIGLSVDSIYSHIAWMRDIEERFGTAIPFPVVADPEKHIANMFDLINDETGLTMRGVFIIDPKGVLRFSAYYPIPLGRKMDEFVRILKALQTIDEYGVSCPCDWQPGQDVILGAPVTLEAAKQRSTEGAETWYIKKQPLPQS